MSNKLLSIDIETGGIGKEFDILTLALIEADNKGEEISTLELDLIPDDGIYKVAPDALAINKIDLVILSKTAIAYREAGTMIYEYLNRISNQGSEKLFPIGKNVYGDVDFITNKLLRRSTWEKFCSYRKIELSSIGQYLIEIGKLPSTISGSLISYCEHFGIDTSIAHTSYGDAKLNLSLWKEFIKL